MREISKIYQSKTRQLFQQSLSQIESELLKYAAPLNNKTQELTTRLKSKSLGYKVGIIKHLIEQDPNLQEPYSFSRRNPRYIKAVEKLLAEQKHSQIEWLENSINSYTGADPSKRNNTFDDIEARLERCEKHEINNLSGSYKNIIFLLLSFTHEHQAKFPKTALLFHSEKNEHLNDKEKYNELKKYEINAIKSDPETMRVDTLRAAISTSLERYAISAIESDPEIMRTDSLRAAICSIYKGLNRLVKACINNPEIQKQENFLYRFCNTLIDLHLEGKIHWAIRKDVIWLLEAKISHGIDHDGMIPGISSILNNFDSALNICQEFSNRQEQRSNAENDSVEPNIQNPQSHSSSFTRQVLSTNSPSEALDSLQK